MTWIKNGLIFKPENNFPYMVTHAQVPLVDPVSEEIWRIYFATRDAKGISRPTYIEVEANNPSNIKYINNRPLLEPGKIGTFDDCGIIPTAIVNDDSRKLMYYAGWNVRNTVPYHNTMGLAISEDGGKTFNKFSEGPILAPTYKEPYFIGLGSVIKEKDRWKIWYSCCTGWEIDPDLQKPEPLYRIHYAESLNGIDWIRNGVVALDYANQDEGGLATSSVYYADGFYHMYFCYRNITNYRTNSNCSYKIGYAKSRDGLNWDRDNQPLLQSSALNEWDSAMQAYPFVLNTNKKQYMFYNGNGFGRSGFGYAVKVV